MDADTPSLPTTHLLVPTTPNLPVSRSRRPKRLAPDLSALWPFSRNRHGVPRCGRDCFHGYPHGHGCQEERAH